MNLKSNSLQPMRMCHVILLLAMCMLIAQISSGDVRTIIVSTAREQIGKPYSTTGEAGPDAFDCSGLVYYCNHIAGITAGRTTAANILNIQCDRLASKDALLPGDLVFHAGTNPDHVGIYVGNDRVVDAEYYIDTNGNLVAKVLEENYIWDKANPWTQFGRIKFSYWPPVAPAGLTIKQQTSGQMCPKPTWFDTILQWIDSNPWAGATELFGVAIAKDNGTPQTIPPVSDLSSTLSNLPPGNYTWSVKAIVNGVESASVNGSPFTISEPPAPPTLIPGAPYTPIPNAPSLSNDGAVYLSWQATGHPQGKAVQYSCEILRKSDGGRQWISAWLTDTNTGWWPLPPGEYNWYVLADDGTKQSPWAWGASFTIGSADTHITITSPSNGATLSGPSVTINWSSGGSNDRFYVYHDAKLIAGPITAHTFTEKLVHPGTHTYTVKGKSGQTTTDSNKVTVTIPDTSVKITSPASGEVSGISVILTWDGGAGNAKYYVYHDARLLDNMPTTAHTWTESPVKAGTHTYTVRGRDANGNWTHSDKVTVTTVPGDTGLTITSPLDGATVTGPVTITWSAGSGLSRFNVRRSGEKLNATYILPPQYTFKETSVRIGSQQYSVVGHDINGIETRATITVTVNCSKWTTFTSPQYGVILPSGSPVTLTWDSSSGVSNFNIHHDATRLNKTPLTSHTFTEAVVHDGSHLYEVTGHDSNNIEYKDFVLVHVGDFHVTLTNATVTGYDVDLSWESSDKNTGFLVERKDAYGSNAWISEILPGTARTYHLTAEPTGTHSYTIVGLETVFGEDPTGSDTATLTINPTATLAMTADGAGAGYVLVNGVMQQLPLTNTFVAGEIVNLEAVPVTNSSFVGWSGDIDSATRSMLQPGEIVSTANDTSISMDSDKSVTPVFDLLEYTFSLTKDGAGTGQVKVNDVLQALPYSATYPYGTIITLEAIPDAGSEYKQWSGSAVGNTNPLPLTIIGDTSINVTFISNSLCRTPDACVKIEGDGAFLGGHIYNTDGTGQTVTSAVAAGSTATYRVKLENDGNVEDNFTLKGTAGGSGWTVKYTYLTTDVTAQMTSTTGWLLPMSLLPTQSLDIQVEVSPSSAVTFNALKELTLTATSKNATTKKDVVKLRTNCAANYQPDAMVRLSTDTTYVGDNTYSLDGTGESKTTTVAVNTLAVFYMLLQNDGNVAQPLRLKATGGATGWTMKYLLSGTTDITAQVTGADGYTLPEVAAHAMASSYLRIQMLPTTALTSSSCEARVTLTSILDNSKSDTIKVTANATVTRQPDASVKLDGGAYIGGNIYNTDGTDQIVASAVSAGSTAVYRVKLQNNGNVVDNYTLKGTAGGSWTTVKYIDLTTDITAQVTSTTGWMLPESLLPGQSREIRVEVSLSSAVAFNALKVLTLTVTSKNDATKKDVVKLRTTCAANYQPDALVRLLTETVYIGYDVYNSNGAGQTKVSTVAVNNTAIYYVRMQNDGNVAQALRLTASASATGWTVKYLLNGKTDISAQMTSAGYTLPEVVAFSMSPSFIVVQVTPTSALTNATCELPITVKSAVDTGKNDTVKLTTSTTITRQPDASVQQDDGAYIGGNIYNSDGTDQTVAAVASAGSSAIYRVKLENDGNVVDSYTLKGNGSGSAWTVKYSDMSTDITAQVTSTTGWTLPVRLLPGQSREIRVEVSPSSAVALNALKELTLTLTSKNDGTKKDVLKLRSTCLAGYQPDTLVRLSTDGNSAYLGYDIYNNDGTGQTREGTAVVDKEVLYYVRVQNDGNVAQAMRLKGDAGAPGWTVTYSLNGTDITGQVTSLDGYTLPEVAARTISPALIQVLVTPTIALSNMTCVTRVTATSAVDAGKSDTVKLSTSVVAP